MMIKLHFICVELDSIPLTTDKGGEKNQGNVCIFLFFIQRFFCSQHDCICPGKLTAEEAKAEADSLMQDGVVRAIQMGYR